MNFVKNNRAFSIVELLVVIVVIAILATIGFVAYNWVVDDARDAQVKAFANDVGKALVAAYTREDKKPENGGYFSNSNGVDATLSGYLDSRGKRSELPNKNQPFRYYQCGSSIDGFAIYGILNSPTSEDISNMKSIK